MQLVKKIHNRYFDTFFDASSRLWTGDCKKDMNTMLSVQSTSNKILSIRGYLYLYEVLRMFKYPDNVILRAKEARVGWTKRGTGRIDFGLFDGYSDEYLSGMSDVLLLRFNLEGILKQGLC